MKPIKPRAVLLMKAAYLKKICAVADVDEGFILFNLTDFKIVSSHE